VSDVQVPSIADTLKDSGIDPQGAGDTSSISSSTSIADETPGVGLEDALDSVREAEQEVPGQAPQPPSAPQAPQQPPYPPQQPPLPPQQ